MVGEKWLWGGIGGVVLLLAAGDVLAVKPSGDDPAGEAIGAEAIGPHAMVRVAVQSMLRAQEEAWNRGDIEAFMEYYWKSDDLTFSSGGKTTRGWQATLDNYKERYPTREKMGKVSFQDLEITPLGDATSEDVAAMVLGRWQLDREREPVGGNFTLVFRKIDGRWAIVHDHTSRAVEEENSGTGER
jgi:beta-aspartyl-peptidase (threonine type)